MNTPDADRFIRHIRACTNAVLPGGRVELRIGSASVGWVAPGHAPARPLPDRASFERYVAELRANGTFRYRAEAFDVRDGDGTVVARVDRGALPLLGIKAAGAHLNGLVRRADGLHVWVGRRATDKRLEPNKLDHITAGGVPAGHDARSTLIKEAEEEASLQPALVATAAEVATIDYAMSRPEGLRRDRLHCFDLLLPDDVAPRPNDGEVVGFTLMRLTDVARRVAETDDFKFNVNLVLIDLFLRTGVLDPDGAVGRPVAEAMRALRPG